MQFTLVLLGLLSIASPALAANCEYAIAIGADTPACGESSRKIIENGVLSVDGALIHFPSGKPDSDMIYAGSLIGIIHNDANSCSAHLDLHLLQLAGGAPLDEQGQLDALAAGVVLRPCTCDPAVGSNGKAPIKLSGEVTLAPYTFAAAHHGCVAPLEGLKVRKVQTEE